MGALRQEGTNQTSKLPEMNISVSSSQIKSRASQPEKLNTQVEMEIINNSFEDVQHPVVSIILLKINKKYYNQPLNKGFYLKSDL